MAIDFKRIELSEVGNFAHLTILGKLDATDYELFVPELDQLIKEHGKINLLVELIEFHGWTLSAAWEDTKFGIKHFNDINRMAIVGDKAWEKGMAFFAKAFTTADVKYFNNTDRDQALKWAVGSEKGNR
jgi:hypothetical protein